MHFLLDSTQPKKVALCEKTVKMVLGGGGYPPLSQPSQTLSNVAFQGYTQKWVGTPGPPLPQNLFQFSPPGGWGGGGVGAGGEKMVWGRA